MKIFKFSILCIVQGTLHRTTPKSSKASNGNGFTYSSSKNTEGQVDIVLDENNDDDLFIIDSTSPDDLNFLVKENELINLIDNSPDKNNLNFINQEDKRNVSFVLNSTDSHCSIGFSSLIDIFHDFNQQSTKNTVDLSSYSTDLFDFTNNQESSNNSVHPNSQQNGFINPNLELDRSNSNFQFQDTSNLGSPSPAFTLSNGTLLDDQNANPPSEGTREILHHEFFHLLKRMCSHIVFNFTELKEILSFINEKEKVDQFIELIYSFSHYLKMFGLIDIYEMNLSSEWEDLEKFTNLYIGFLRTRGIKTGQTFIDLKNQVFNIIEPSVQDIKKFYKTFDQEQNLILNFLASHIDNCDHSKLQNILLVGYILYDITTYFWHNLKNVYFIYHPAISDSKSLFVWALNAVFNTIKSPVLKYLENSNKGPELHWNEIKKFNVFIYTILMIVKNCKNNFNFRYDIFKLHDQILNDSYTIKFTDKYRERQGRLDEILIDDFYVFLTKLKINKEFLILNKNQKNSFYYFCNHKELNGVLSKIEKIFDEYFDHCYNLINSIVSV